MQNATVNVTLRLDREIKENAEILFKELGMNLTTAFNVFIRQSLRLGKIPFEVADPFYSEKNMSRLRESIAKAEAGKLKKRALIED
ncbi:MAG: type II toxin-antitoxin system RelB/DinJ family antitoxin [bacterium]